MAESLGVAWRELNRQLDLRGYILEDTLKFYQEAERHAQTISQTNNLFRAFNSGNSGQQVVGEIQAAFNSEFKKQKGILWESARSERTICSSLNSLLIYVFITFSEGGIELERPLFRLTFFPLNQKRNSGTRGVFWDITYFSGLLDSTAKAVDLGSGIITQIRALGNLADNPERPAETANACLQIEKVMLR